MPVYIRNCEKLGIDMEEVKSLKMNIERWKKLFHDKNGKIEVILK